MFGKLLILFIAVPIAELYLFMTIGSQIGLLQTLLIIALTAVLGAWLTRMQGARALERFQKASAEGRLPHEEVIDGLMILIAGIVLLTPGFLTDAVGFALLTPPVRSFLRKHFAQALKSRVQIVTPGGATPGAAPGRPPRTNDDGVIEAEVEVMKD
ncbi:MAG: FxsA family protein [Verrucomicrobiales bacterium]